MHIYSRMEDSENLRRERGTSRFITLKWLISNFILIFGHLIAFFLKVFPRRLPLEWQPSTTNWKTFNTRNLRRCPRMPFHTFQGNFAFTCSLKLEKFCCLFSQAVFLKVFWVYWLSCGHPLPLEKLVLWRICEKADMSRLSGFLLHTWHIKTCCL